MDLRPYGLTPRQVKRAARVLSYQPFIISDDLQTGVAWSWISGEDPRVSPPLVFRRDQWGDKWDAIHDANARLRAMYDDFIFEIVARFPGGSLLDIACKNGYFPIKAQLSGMTPCAGMDIGSQYRRSIKFLNRVAGTRVKFVHGAYEPRRLKAPIRQRYDVVVASAIMCHLPDPLHFLADLGRIARRAIFFFGQIVDTDQFLIAYARPHSAISDARAFPFSLNENTRLSIGLLWTSLEMMGFHKIMEFQWRDTWLPRELFVGYGYEQHLPNIQADTEERRHLAAKGARLLEELRGKSRHLAILAMR